MQKIKLTLPKIGGPGTAPLDPPLAPGRPRHGCPYRLSACSELLGNRLLERDDRLGRACGLQLAFTRLADSQQPERVMETGE